MSTHWRPDSTELSRFPCMALVRRGLLRGRSGVGEFECRSRCHQPSDEGARALEGFRKRPQVMSTALIDVVLESRRRPAEHLHDLNETLTLANRDDVVGSPVVDLKLRETRGEVDG